MEDDGRWNGHNRREELARRSPVLVSTVMAMALMSRLPGGDAPALPSDAQKIAEKADLAITALKTSTDAQIGKIKAQEVKDLQRLCDASVKKGDQAQAAAIKQRIDSIGSSAAASPAPAKGEKIDLAGIAPGSAGWIDASGDLFGGENAGVGIWNMVYLPGTRAVVASVVKHGLWATLDGGVHWKRLGESGNRPPDAGQAVQFLLDPQDPNRLWCSGMYGFGCWRTDDGGLSFKKLGDQTHLDGMAVDFSDAERKTLITGGHEQARSARLSIDGGVTWKLIGDRLPDDSSFSTLPIVLDKSTFIINTSGWGDKKWGIYRSTDGGQAWTKVSDVGAADCALVTRSGTIFYSLFWNMDHIVSRDHGLTWTKLGAPVRRQLIELPDGTLAGLGGGNQRQPYFSSDDGRTWTPFGAEVPFKPCDWGTHFIYNPSHKSFFCYCDTPPGPGPHVVMRMDITAGRPPAQ